MIEAVRVPPSAWITSQSSQIVRSPRTLHVDDGAKRAADQPLDLHRPPALVSCAQPRAAVRWRLARGSIPYSAVTQPVPVPLRNGGTFSSTEAVQMTRVSPTSIRHEPSGYLR